MKKDWKSKARKTPETVQTHGDGAVHCGMMKGPNLKSS